MAAMGSQRADAALRAYLETTPFSSLYFTPEALILESIAGSQQFAATLSTCAFEQALLVAKRPRSSLPPGVSCQRSSFGREALPHPSAA